MNKTNQACALALDAFYSVLSERANADFPLRSVHYTGLSEPEILKLIRSASDFAEILTESGESYTWTRFVPSVPVTLYTENHSGKILTESELVSVLIRSTFTITDC